MSTSFLMSVASNQPKPPETNDAGTVTKWVPIPTAFPSQEGCANALISARLGNLTGWDPGYAITVDASVRCWPPGATTWWDQSDPLMTISLGPVVCPEAYYTAASSVKDNSSTLIACCPSDYVFQTGAPISQVAPISQCISPIAAGQVFDFASDFGGNSGWLKTSTTASEPTSVLGVPFNGWQLKEATTAAAPSTSSPAATSSASTPSQTVPPTQTLASDNPLATLASQADSSNELSLSAKVGIGVGVGVGVILVVAILLWVFIDPLSRFQRHRLADRVEAASRAQGRGPSPPQPPTPPSLRELALNSPTPPSLSPGEQLPMSPLSSEVLSLSSGGYQREPQDMTELDHFPAPAPVIGGMGITRSGSALSQHSRNASNRYNNYSAGEWVHGRSGSQSSYPRRPSTSQMGRPSTSRSNAAVGLWGIDPTGQGIRSDSQSSASRAGPSAPSPTVGLGRSSSQRSARIVTSPLEIGGQRYDMVFEV